MSASKKADTPKTKIKTLAPIKTSHSGAPNCCSGFFMKNTTKTCTEKFPGAQVGTAWKSSGSAQKPRMSGKATYRELTETEVPLGQMQTPLTNECRSNKH